MGKDFRFFKYLREAEPYTLPLDDDNGNQMIYNQLQQAAQSQPPVEQVAQSEEQTQPQVQEQPAQEVEQPQIQNPVEVADVSESETPETAPEPENIDPIEQIFENLGWQNWFNLEEGGQQQ